MLWCERCGDGDIGSWRRTCGVVLCCADVGLFVSGEEDLGLVVRVLVCCVHCADEGEWRGLGRNANGSSVCV